MRYVAALFVGASLACGHPSNQAIPERPAPTTCNGHPELCDRAYDRVSFPGTHDAYANLEEHFVAADQSFPLRRQLDDGVRVLHLEVIQNLPNREDAYLCHGVCGLGKKLLADGLSEVDAFLGAHPDDVVTLLMESSGLPTDTIAAAFATSGLLKSVHTQASGTPWPTLGHLIEHGDRVVVLYVDLTSTGGTAFPWLLGRWAWTWETPWNNVTTADFGRCNVDRGTMGNALYVVDTYLEDLALQTAANAARVNRNPFLLERLLYCQKSTATLPNFVMVNYYEVGDVLRDVDVLNGFLPAPAGVGATPPASFD